MQIGTKIAFGWQTADARDLVLMRAKAVDVDMVLVGGQVVLKDGNPTRFDLREVEKSLATELAAQSPPTHQQTLVAALRPYLIQWYANWEQPQLQPYAVKNSRV